MEGNKELFIKKSIERHGSRYDYSKVNYVNSQTKVCIVCPEHGEFWQEPSAHVRGYNCPKCGNINRGRYRKWDLDEFIKRAREVHGDKYNYSKVEYKGNDIKVCIVCPEHGEFWQKPSAHVLCKQGCPKCSGRNLNTEEIIKEFRDVHGDKYDYSKVEYTKMHNKVCIICPEHGEFYQTPSKHLLGQGCRKCGIDKRSEKHTMSTEEFIRKAMEVHGDKYDYSKTVYTKAHDELTIICPKHGEFRQVANYHLCGHGCPICGNNMSIGEDEIVKYIESLGIKVEVKNRTILDGGKEIDILIPDYNIGIEFDGLKWHSDEFKEDNYHLNKTLECEKKGIRLIHVFEDEWIYKQDIVKSIISNILGKTNKRVYARTCKIKEVSKGDKKEFLNNNHLQGDVNSEINLGLFYNDELVSVMTFGKPRINLGNKIVNENEWELVRFCNKLNTNVIGGASKLLKYFVDNYNPLKIISYADRRWSQGNMYEKIGFIKDHNSQPNYYYIEGINRKNRFKYRKSELVKEGFDKHKSEREIMKERGINRIYDCGTIVYVWKKKGIV